MDDMNDSGSYELRVLDVMNSLGFCFISMTLGHELKAIDARNSSGLWMT